MSSHNNNLLFNAVLDIILIIINYMIRHILIINQMICVCII